MGEGLKALVTMLVLLGLCACLLELCWISLRGPY
jgi:hypothetical protein